MENAPPNRSFVFEDFSLEVESQIFRRNRSEIHLARRPFEVLVYLIENRARVVSRDELFDKFWDGHDVYDDALRKTVGAIRQAIEDTKKPPRLIETRYGSGYRFIGAVDEIAVNGNGNGNGNHAAIKTNFVENSVNELIAKPARRSFPYVLAGILTAAILFFVSLGFYVYFPNGKNQALLDDPLQNSAPVRRSRSCRSKI
jgi:DNA-binding winged helix-turn-helix (wHTH) protein